MGKCLLFAAVGLVLLFCASTIVLRIMQPKKRARALTLLFLLSLPFYCALYASTPADLGFFPAWLVEAHFTVEILMSLFLYGASFFGGLLQLYNLADRGFSLRVVMDIARAGRGLTLDEICDSYSEGKGLNWMYAKRIQGLVETRLGAVKHGHLVNLERGTRLAKAFAFLRAFFHFPMPSNQSRSHKRPAA